jgi:putative protease
MNEKDEIKVPAFLRKKRQKRANVPKRGKKTIKKKSIAKKAKSKTKKKAVTKQKKTKKPKARPKKIIKAKKKPSSKKPKKNKKLLKKLRPANKEEKKKIAGKVTHYFDKIEVAIVKAKLPIKLGQELIFEGKSSFKHKLTAMQFNHEEIKSAKKGQEVGIKVKKPVKAGDIVYLRY